MIDLHAEQIGSDIVVECFTNADYMDSDNSVDLKHDIYLWVRCPKFVSSVEGQLRKELGDVKGNEMVCLATFVDGVEQPVKFNVIRLKEGPEEFFIWPGILTEADCQIEGNSPGLASCTPIIADPERIAFSEEAFTNMKKLEFVYSDSIMNEVTHVNFKYGEEPTEPDTLSGAWEEGYYAWQEAYFIEVWGEIEVPDMTVCGHDLLYDRLFGLHKSEMDGLSALITTELKNQLTRWIRLCEGSWDTYEDYMYHLGWAGTEARNELIFGIAEVLRPWLQFMPGRPDLAFTNEMTGFGETSWEEAVEDNEDIAARSMHAFFCDYAGNRRLSHTDYQKHTRFKTPSSRDRANGNYFELKTEHGSQRVLGACL